MKFAAGPAHDGRGEVSGSGLRTGPMGLPRPVLRRARPEKPFTWMGEPARKGKEMIPGGDDQASDRSWRNSMAPSRPRASTTCCQITLPRF